MNLAELVKEHVGEEPKVPFYARNGHRVEVTAVLERTAVIHDGDISAKRLVRLSELTVDDWAALEWFVTAVTLAGRSAMRGRALSLVQQSNARKSK